MTAPSPDSDLAASTPTTPPSTRPTGAAGLVIDPTLVAQAHVADHSQFPIRAALFLGLYASAAAGAVWVAANLSGWALVSLAPLYLVAACALHGVSLFTHEAVHGVLSPNTALNHLLGAVCALPVLQNFAAYRVLHLRHHAHLGASGDPDHFENYSARRWLVYAMHWGRLLLGYPAYIVAIPLLAFRAGSWGDRAAIVAESSALALAVTAAVLYVPSVWLWHAWVGPMVIINTLVNIRGMSQHTLLAEESDVIHGTRTILGNPVSRFFMCNENFHLEHHLYPGVPWYNLPRLHAALGPQLLERGAPFINGYVSFVAAFIAVTLFGKTRNTVTLR